MIQTKLRLVSSSGQSLSFYKNIPFLLKHFRETKVLSANLACRASEAHPAGKVHLESKGEHQFPFFGDEWSKVVGDFIVWRHG